MKSLLELKTESQKLEIDDYAIELNNKRIISSIKAINPENPMEYVVNLIKPLTIESFNDKIYKCNKCSIGCTGKEHKSSIFGNANSPILVITDYIKTNRINEKHTPLLDEYHSLDMWYSLLKNIGVNGNLLLYCNCVNCFPYNNCNEPRLPSLAEINNCYNNIVYKLIESIRPKMLIILGNVALRAFSHHSFLSVRGQMSEILGIPTMVTYTPSYFHKMLEIKNEEVLEKEFDDFIEDINNAFLYFKTNYDISDIAI